MFMIILEDIQSMMNAPTNNADNYLIQKSARV